MWKSFLKRPSTVAPARRERSSAGTWRNTITTSYAVEWDTALLRKRLSSAVLTKNEALTV